MPVITYKLTSLIGHDDKKLDDKDSLESTKTIIILLIYLRYGQDAYVLLNMFFMELEKVV